MVDDRVYIEVEHIPEDVELLILVFLQLLVLQDVFDFLLTKGKKFIFQKRKKK
jgi:hypothetical protein